MSHFNEAIINLSVPQRGQIRTLLSEINYYSDLVGEKIKVPIGFKTDLGSIPRLLQGIFPKDGKAMFAYILHDYLYKTGKYTRSQCDAILEEAMEVLKVGYFTRKSVRFGLWTGGWVSWNKHRKNDKD